MKCRFIDSGFLDAYTNMAVDESLLLSCKEPTLRVYSWSKPSMTIGYNQNPFEEINLEICREKNIPVVRRITGGKAVLHGKEITYSFIVPEDMVSLPKDVAESYKAIADALIFAFKVIGLDAEMQKQAEKIPTPICFSSANWYEITSKNRKISGSAQRRLKGKILQHGPLIIDFDYGLNALVFSNGKRDFTAEILKRKITSIKNEIDRIPSYHELASSIKQGFKKTFNFEFYEGELTKEESNLAEELKEKKYMTDDWNLRREVLEYERYV